MDMLPSILNKENTTSNETHELTAQDFLFIYVRETIEVFLAITIIRVALDKPLEIYETVQASVFIGVLTTLLEYYDKDFKKSIKGGINAVAGTQMISRFINK